METKPFASTCNYLFSLYLILTQYNLLNIIGIGAPCMCIHAVYTHHITNPRPEHLPFTIINLVTLLLSIKLHKVHNSNIHLGSTSLKLVLNERFICVRKGTRRASLLVSQAKIKKQFGV